MLELLSNMHWYELLFGLVAVGFLGYIAFFAVMAVLLMGFFYFVVNDTFRNIVIVAAVAGAAYYIFDLVQKYT